MPEPADGFAWQDTAVVARLGAVLLTVRAAVTGPDDIDPDHRDVAIESGPARSEHLGSLPDLVPGDRAQKS